MPAQPPRLIAPQDDLYRAFAQALLASTPLRDGAPGNARPEFAPRDLSRLVIIIPPAAPVAPLRRAFAHAAGSAVLGPSIITLHQLPDLPEVFGDVEATSSNLHEFECKLMLADVLSRGHQPFPGQDIWQLADALYNIFEALAAECSPLVPDAQAFEDQLIRAYGTPHLPRPLSALSREARIVHQLWQAYQVATEGRSPALLRQTRLEQAARGLQRHFTQPQSHPRTHPREFKAHLHVLGMVGLEGGTRRALQALFDSGHATLWLHGVLHGRDGAAIRSLIHQLRLPEPILLAPTRHESVHSLRNQLLDAAFAFEPAHSNEQLSNRDHPLALRLIHAQGPEHEARCIALAIRQGIHRGAHEIAIVSEDRRLARRLRALLERSGLALEDEIGWALSTSAAAAAVNAWLDCLESSFHFRPMLKLLKSSFMAAAIGTDMLTRFERDLVVGLGIESGLDSWLQALQREVVQLEEFREIDARLKLAFEILRRAAQAFAAIQPTATTERISTAGDQWFAALSQSLDELALSTALQGDPAGSVLLETLAQLHTAYREFPLPLSWAEFRTQLDRALEAATFRSAHMAHPPSDARIRLLTLDRSAALRADLLILASATAALLPSTGAAEPFFNQGVRAELQLPTTSSRQQQALARLRCTLQAAPEVLITYAAQAPGEPAQLSPWIEAIESQAHAWGLNLRETRLPALAQLAASDVVQNVSDAGANPPTTALPPAPRAPRALLPQRISASAHQRLLDCPYRFFAQDMLRLNETPWPDQVPDRSDYGDRVHQILQRYTEHQPTPDSREASETILRTIADEVFAADLATRALARVWITEFHSAIPAWLDWLEKRPAVPTKAEQYLDRSLADRWHLTGMADRIEQRAEQAHTLVDYKTGRQLPTEDQVMSGEAVQLAHYALLDERIDCVEYLSLHPHTLRLDRKTLRVDGAPLHDLRDAVAARLDSVLESISRWAPIPANGDDLQCSRCEFSGVCRRADWLPPAPTTSSAPTAESTAESTAELAAEPGAEPSERDA